MTVKISTALATAMMTGGSLKSLLDGGFIYIYSGPVPATADAAIDGGCVLLAKISDLGGATGLTFATPATNGVIQKTASETWQDTNINASGTMSFFRFCEGADTGSGAAGASDYRVQGTIGTDMSFDLYLPSPAVTAGNTITLNSFQIQQPTA